jgi:hypothetical protein
MLKCTVTQWIKLFFEPFGFMIIVVRVLVSNYVLGVMPFWIKNTLQKERPKRGLIV